MVFLFINNIIRRDFNLKNIIQNYVNYIPERLFVYNLINVMDINVDEDFCHSLTCDIDSKMKDMLDELKKISEKKYIIDRSKIAAEMEHMQELYRNKTIGVEYQKQAKYGDYFLLKQYIILKKILNDNKQNGNLKENKLKPDENLKRIVEYYQMVFELKQRYDAQAISLKSLKSLLTPSGPPYKKGKQVNMIVYILKEIIPREKNSREQNIISFLRDIRREKMKLIEYDMKSEKQVIFFEERDYERNECEVIISERGELTKKLKQISRIRRQDDYNGVGNILLEIRDDLVTYYNNNIISCIPDEKLSNKSCDKNNENIEDNKAVLSTNILDFIKWLIVIPNNIEQRELMVAIDRILESIHPSVVEYINTVMESSKDSITNLKEDNSKYLQENMYSRIFFKDENAKIRDILVKSLFNDRFFVNLLFNKGNT